MNLARIAIPLWTVMILGGCAGTTTDTQSIMSMSTPEVLEPEVRSAGLEDLKLPEQSPSNVEVFEQRPEFAYFVVDSFRTRFDYEKDSMASKKNEKAKHLKTLRERAGQLGGNGLIVVWSEQTKKGWPSGGIIKGGSPTPMPSTYNKTAVSVTSYAIYRRVD